MKASMIQKLTDKYGGSWIYVSMRGFWISSTGRYALKMSSSIYVSREGRFHKER